MNYKLNKELVLQISIVITCLFTLFVRFSNVPTRAQALCNGQPPLLNPVNPKKEAWAPGTGVAPVVFDTPNPLDFQLISEGIQMWNDLKYQNCSNVFFYDAI